VPPSPESVGSAAIRDPRSTRLQQRQPGLLVTSLQQLESLLQTTPLRAPERPILLRRLAEDYDELANAMVREEADAEVAHDEARRGERQRTEKQARKAAIEDYQTLASEYAGAPSRAFPQSPPAPYAEIDAVFYFLGLEYEATGDGDDARQAWYELVQKRPSSRLVSLAYLGFGETTFRNGSYDATQWPIVKGAYEKAVSFAQPGDMVAGYASYKLAHVDWRMGDLDGARAAFAKAVDFATSHADLPGASKLADAARRDAALLPAQPCAAPG
jgi:TolA-binding protein